MGLVAGDSDFKLTLSECSVKITVKLGNNGFELKAGALLLGKRSKLEINWPVSHPAQMPYLLNTFSSNAIPL